MKLFFTKTIDIFSGMVLCCFLRLLQVARGIRRQQTTTFPQKIQLLLLFLHVAFFTWRFPGFSTRILWPPLPHWPKWPYGSSTWSGGWSFGATVTVYWINFKLFFSHIVIGTMMYSEFSRKRVESNNPSSPVDSTAMPFLSVLCVGLCPGHCAGHLAPRDRVLNFCNSIKEPLEKQLCIFLLPRMVSRFSSV